MYKTIKYLYPNAEDSDFQLRDDSDGNGVYLDFWNENKLGAKPEMSFIISKMTRNKDIDRSRNSSQSSPTPSPTGAPRHYCR
jgi:hypothetical protein